VHAGEQDVVTFKFPDTKEEFVDLAQVATYMSLPLDVFTNQQEQIDKLSMILTYVIYSQEQTEAVGIKTATEITINYSRIYNKLYPIALKVGQVESLAYRVGMQYYGAFRDGDSYHVTFPMDFAMKKESELIADLAAVADYRVLSVEFCFCFHAPLLPSPLPPVKVFFHKFTQFIGKPHVCLIEGRKNFRDDVGKEGEKRIEKRDLSAKSLAFKASIDDIV